MTTLIVISVILIIGAYKMGKNDGIFKANVSALYRGAWAELTDGLWIKMPGKKHMLIPEHTKVIIMGKNKWGQISIWLAEPMPNQVRRNFHGIEKFARFKILNPQNIRKEVLEEAIKSLSQFEANARQWHVPGLQRLFKILCQVKKLRTFHQIYTDNNERQKERRLRLSKF